MASDFEDLIEWILSEIVFSGKDGISVSEVLALVDAFYDGPYKKVAESQQDEASNVEKQRPSTDGNSVAKIWASLKIHPDFFIGEDRDGERVGLEEVEALLTDHYQELQDKSSRQSKTLTEYPHLYVSEDRIWKTIAGHGINHQKVPPREWELLYEIAMTRGNGMLQPELLRITGQDKHSVPRRTDKMAQKGYIEKRIVYIYGKSKSSLLILKKFASKSGGKEMAGIPNPADLPKEIIVRDLEPVPGHERFIGILIDTELLARTVVSVVQAWGSMPYSDLRQKLNVEERPWQRKILQVIVRELRASGVLQKTTDSSHEHDFDGSTVCIRFAREPTLADWSPFQIKPNGWPEPRPKRSKADRKARQRKQETSDQDGEGTGESSDETEIPKAARVEGFPSANPASIESKSDLSKAAGYGSPSNLDLPLNPIPEDTVRNASKNTHRGLSNSVLQEPPLNVPSRGENMQQNDKAAAQITSLVDIAKLGMRQSSLNEDELGEGVDEGDKDLESRLIQPQALANPPRRRGRPPKARKIIPASEVPITSTPAQESTNFSTEITSALPLESTSEPKISPLQPEAPAKRRGRPPKSKDTPVVANMMISTPNRASSYSSEQMTGSLPLKSISDPRIWPIQPETPARRRGRPPKFKDTPIVGNMMISTAAQESSHSPVQMTSSIPHESTPEPRTHPVQPEPSSSRPRRQVQPPRFKSMPRRASRDSLEQMSSTPSLESTPEPRTPRQGRPVSRKAVLVSNDELERTAGIPGVYFDIPELHLKRSSIGRPKKQMVALFKSEKLKSVLWIVEREGQRFIASRNKDALRSPLTVDPEKTVESLNEISGLALKRKRNTNLEDDEIQPQSKKAMFETIRNFGRSEPAPYQSPFQPTSRLYPSLGDRVSSSKSPWLPTGGPERPPLEDSEALQIKNKNLEDAIRDAADIELSDVAHRLPTSKGGVAGNLCISLDKRFIIFVESKNRRKPSAFKTQISEMPKDPQTSTAGSYPVELLITTAAPNNTEMVHRFRCLPTEDSFQAVNDMRAKIVTAMMISDLERDNINAEPEELERPFSCENCGGTWKNWEGIKYHQTKSKTACNPNYVSVIKSLEARRAGMSAYNQEQGVRMHDSSGGRISPESRPGTSDGEITILPSKIKPVSLGLAPDSASTGLRAKELLLAGAEDENSRTSDFRLDNQGRKDLILALLNANGRVFPGERGLWFAFVALSQQKFPNSGLPSYEDCDSALDLLIDTGAVRKVQFSFKDERGLMTMRSLITANSVDPTSVEVTDLKEKIKNTFPGCFFPPGFAPSKATQSIIEEREKRQNFERLQDLASSIPNTDDGDLIEGRTRERALAPGKTTRSGRTSRKPQRLQLVEDSPLLQPMLELDFGNAGETIKSDRDESYDEGNPEPTPKRRKSRLLSLARVKTSPPKKRLLKEMAESPERIEIKLGRKPITGPTPMLPTQMPEGEPEQDTDSDRPLRRVKKRPGRLPQDTSRLELWQQAMSFLQVENGAWNYPTPARTKLKYSYKPRLPEPITYMQQVDNSAWSFRPYGHGVRPVHARPAKRGENSTAYFDKLFSGFRPVTMPPSARGAPGQLIDRDSYKQQRDASFGFDRRARRARKRQAKVREGETLASLAQTVISGSGVTFAGTGPTGFYSLPKSQPFPVPDPAKFKVYFLEPNKFLDDSPGDSDLSLLQTLPSDRQPITGRALENSASPQGERQALAGQNLDEPYEIRWTETRVLKGENRVWPTMKLDTFMESSFSVKGWFPPAKYILKQLLPRDLSGVLQTKQGRAILVDRVPSPQWAAFLSEVEDVERWEQGKGRNLLTIGTVAPDYIFINHTFATLESLPGPAQFDLHWLKENQLMLESMPTYDLDDGDPRYQHQREPKRKQIKYRPQRVMKTRRLTALPGDFRSTGMANHHDLGLEVALDKLNQQRKRIKEGSMSPTVENRLIVAVVVIRSLTGGLDRQIDWVLVARLFPQFPMNFISKHWAKVHPKNKGTIEKLGYDFQDFFIEAYESGEVPAIDYDNLLSYDWSSLVDMVQQRLDISPPTSNSIIPASRDNLNRSFYMKKINENKPWRDSFFALARPVYRRMDDAASEQHATPLIKGKPDDFGIDELVVAKTWARANTLTPLASYNEEFASQKLATLASGMVHTATTALFESKVLMQRNKGRPLPGRGVQITDSFASALRKHIDESQLSRAAAMKATVDKAFLASETVMVEWTADDGAILGITNMQANGRIKLKPVGAPMNRFGLTDGDYQTKMMDKARLRFDVQLFPTDSYIYDSDLPIPDGMSTDFEPPRGIDGAIPVWCDIADNLIPELWKQTLCVVLGVIAMRPGVLIKELVRIFNPALDMWEMRLLIDWCVRAGALTVLREGYEGWNVGEWWWLIGGRV